MTPDATPTPLDAAAAGPEGLRLFGGGGGGGGTTIIAWGQRIAHPRFRQPPGNSLPLIDAAYARGYDGVELDVQLSSDDVLVLIHDHTLDATTDLSGPVARLTAEELGRVPLKDPWCGEPTCIAPLSVALAHNGARGPVMVDMYHSDPRHVGALRRSVATAGFDHRRLILLTHSNAGGLALKAAFPEAVVLLKARHDAFPPGLTSDFAYQAAGLDGVLVPIANFKDSVIAFRLVTRRLGLKLAVYMHDGDMEALRRLEELGVDYVTSYTLDRAARAG